MQGACVSLGMDIYGQYTDSRGGQAQANRYPFEHCLRWIFCQRAWDPQALGPLMPERTGPQPLATALVVQHSVTDLEPNGGPGLFSTMACTCPAKGIQAQIY